MKLYTRTGDDGMTGLFGGQRVSKDDLRIEACGAVDELNATLGLALVVCRDEHLANILQAIQCRLFEIGADLSTPRSSADVEDMPGALRVEDLHVEELERWIDEVCALLPEMKSFILPGGSELAARLHLARTTCRRAERRCVALNRHGPITPAVMVYLNRLSDLLFALARRANQIEGIADVPWISGR